MSRASDVKRVVFCTGKVYYDLLQHRMDNKINDVALIRIEQLTPFPFDKVEESSCPLPNFLSPVAPQVLEEAQLYSNAEVVWAQEEPRNMGAWSYVCPRIQAALKDARGVVQPVLLQHSLRITEANDFLNSI